MTVFDKMPIRELRIRQKNARQELEKQRQLFYAVDLELQKRKVAKEADALEIVEVIVEIDPPGTITVSGYIHASFDVSKFVVGDVLLSNGDRIRFGCMHTYGKGSWWMQNYSKGISDIKERFVLRDIKDAIQWIAVINESYISFNTQVEEKSE